MTNYRGPILIHASKGIKHREYHEFCVWYDQTFQPSKPPPSFGELVLGGIVGRANLSDCICASKDPWFQGPYGFVLTDVEPLPFIPYKGALGLFDVPDDVVRLAA